MSKAKFALGLLMVVALFAFTATPALARFTNHGGKGAGKSGEVGWTDESTTLRCDSSEDTYKVNSEGTVLTLTGISWKECSDGATLICESLEFKQTEKEGTEKGKAVGEQISKECVMKIAGACEISYPIESNKELKTISMIKSGSNVDLSVDLRLAGTAKGSGCALIGIAKEKTTTTLTTGLVTESVGLE